MNNDFKIEIKAEDPEVQNITFTLLSNGTLSKAQIINQLVTVPNITENGTIFVQVEDDMGAQNVLIINVNAFNCPCKHDGKCIQKEGISYPVKPSDYLCQCKEPYYGSVCETRPNPCDELPCFPGLGCSFDQNYAYVTCEECPPLFEGDGKQCELKSTEGLREINNMRLYIKTISSFLSFS